MKNLFFVVVALLVVPAFAVHGQQATQNPSATQPGVGTFLFRSVSRYSEYEDDPTSASRDIRRIVVSNWLAYGATPKLSFMFNLPFETRTVDNDITGSTDHIQGIGDMHIMAKYRVYQNDTGPIDTARLSLTLGADLPTGDGPFGGDGIDPMIGLVYTQIKGRHGVNAALRYTFATEGQPGSITPGDGGEDLFQYDASYLYRLAPSSWAADTHGAWYAMFEANGFYETNGDNELLLAPGIMYEARGWVIETSLQLPVWQELDNRPEQKFTWTVGFRILF